MRAYILVQVSPGKEMETIGQLNKVNEEYQGTGRVDFVHGSFDIVASFDMDIRDIDRLVLKIRSLQNVRRTETLLGFEYIPVPESVG
jgi:hypothetical protein